MKHLVLGLFSLALLGFVCAQNPSSIRPTVPIYNSTSNTSWTAYNNTTANNNNISTGSNSINNQTSATATTRTPGTRTTAMPSTADMTVMTTMITKSGQSHILTSVSLLLGSFALHALWQ